MNYAKLTRALTTRRHHNTHCHTFLTSTSTLKPNNVAIGLCNPCNTYPVTQSAGLTPYFSTAALTSAMLTTSLTTYGPFQVRDRDYTSYATGSRLYWLSTTITCMIHNQSELSTLYKLRVWKLRRPDRGVSVFNDVVLNYQNGDLTGFAHSNYILFAERSFKFDLNTQGGSIRRARITIPRNRYVWTYDRQTAGAVQAWDLDIQNDWYVTFESNDLDDTHAAQVMILIRNDWIEGYNA